MEIKKGDHTIKLPGWVIAAGIVTVGTIVSDICKTVEKKRAQFSKTNLQLNIEKFPGGIFGENILYHITSCACPGYLKGIL